MRAQALSQVNIPDAVLDDKVSGTPKSISNAQLLHVDAVVALAERASLFALRLPLHFVERLFPARRTPKTRFGLTRYT